GWESRGGNAAAAGTGQEGVERGAPPPPMFLAARAHSAPFAPFEPNAGCVAREDVGTSVLRDRQAARYSSDAPDDDHWTSPERRLRETSPDRATRRKRDMGHTDAVHDPHRRSSAAAGAARGRAKTTNADKTDPPQPVHPMRLTPLNADWLRYVSSKRFVPHASHLASMI